MIDAPARLADDRVVLRPWRPGDEQALTDAWADADVRRWTPVPAEAGRPAAELWIDGVAARAQAGIAVDLVITEPDADDVIGEVGLYGFDRRRRAAQVGYWMAAGRRGRGLATAAVRLVAEWALVPDRLSLLVARCHVDNDRSQAVAVGAGFVLAGADGDYRLYARVLRAGIAGGRRGNC